MAIGAPPRRQASVGSPKAAVAEILDLAKDAQQAAGEVGRSFADHIDAFRLRDKIGAQGFSAGFTHHTGHHVGFRYHDPGFVILPGESALLEPGMVITIEPGI